MSTATKDQLSELSENWHKCNSEEPEKGKAIALNILDLAIESNDLEKQCDAYNYIGIYHLNKGEYINGITEFEKSIRIAEDNDFIRKKIFAASNLAVCFKFSQQFEQAYKTLAKIDSELDQLSAYDQLRIKINKATTLQYTEYHNEAIQDFEYLVNNLNELKTSTEKGYVLTTYCEYLIFDNNYLKALEYCLEAESYLIKESSSRFLAINYDSLKQIYAYGLRNPEKAIEYGIKSLEINKRLDQKHGIFACHISLLELYTYSGQLDEATKSYQKINELINNYSLESRKLEINFLFYLIETEKIKEAEDLILKSGKFEYTPYLMAIIHYKKGELNTGISILEELTSFKPEDAGLTDLINSKVNEYIYQIFLDSGRLKDAINLMSDLYHQEKELSKNQRAALILEKHFQFENAKKEIEIERLKTEKLSLDRLNSSLEMFAYNTAHDLKQPARTLNNLSKLLMEGNIPDEKTQKEILSFITQSSNRMVNLIDDLLSYAKSENSIFDMHEVDCNHLLNEIFSELKTLIEEHNAKINLKQLPVITGNQKYIRLLFQNIITNSIKHKSPERNPVIEIYSSKEDDFLCINFKDNGVGVPESEQHKIFEPFKKNINSSTNDGTGLGLAICQKIIQQHNGKIKLISEVGKGSEFILCFPLAETRN